MARDGRLYFVAGASRSGKSYWVQQQIKDAPRVVVWDVKGEYAKALKGCRVVHSGAELFRVLDQAGAGPARVALVTADMRAFDQWARIAYGWSVAHGPAVIVGEELADVTTPSKAPPGWGKVCRRVLASGSDVYAITQRPSESDKTAVGNASVIHCHRMARQGDRKYMAAELDVPVEKVAELKPWDYVERDERGQVSTYTHGGSRRRGGRVERAGKA